MINIKRRQLRSFILSTLVVGTSFGGMELCASADAQDQGFSSRRTRSSTTHTTTMTRQQDQTSTAADHNSQWVPARTAQQSASDRTAGTRVQGSTVTPPAPFNPPFVNRESDDKAKADAIQEGSWVPRNDRRHSTTKIYNRFTPWESRNQDRWSNANSQVLEKTYADEDAPEVSRFIQREAQPERMLLPADPPPMPPQAIATTPQQNTKPRLSPPVFEPVPTGDRLAAPAPSAVEPPAFEEIPAEQPAPSPSPSPKAVAKLKTPTVTVEQEVQESSSKSTRVEREVLSRSTASSHRHPAVVEDIPELPPAAATPVSPSDTEIAPAEDEPPAEDVAERLRAVLRNVPDRYRVDRSAEEPAPIEVPSEAASLGGREISPMVPVIRDDEPAELNAQPAKGGNQDPAPVIRKIQITPEVAAMRRPIASVLAYHYNRPESMAERSPWGTFHMMLPFGTDAKVRSGRSTYNSVAWLCGNRPCRGQRLLTTTRSGRIFVRQGVGLQGHQAQLLAMLAQTNVGTDYPLVVGRTRFTVQNLIDAEMEDCRSGQELTFALIGLSNYLPTDSQWTAGDGTLWNFEKLLAEELAQPIVGAACGGTHRLMGLSFALRQRRLEGLPIEGQWARAEAFIKDFTNYAWSLQNADGSFSTDWFEGRADNREIDRKIQTTGHILEWLIFTADQGELQDERFTRSAKFLANAFSRYRTRKWEPGPKGHVLRALTLYSRRVYGDATPWRTQNSMQVAQQRNVRR